MLSHIQVLNVKLRLQCNAVKVLTHLVCLDRSNQLPMVLQDAKFSAQVASLESEVRALKADNASLNKDNKAGCNQIRAKDKQLDSAAKEVEHARQTELHNKVKIR